MPPLPSPFTNCIFTLNTLGWHRCACQWNLSHALYQRAVLHSHQTPPVSICFPTSKANTTLVEGLSFTIYLKGMLCALRPHPRHILPVIVFSKIKILKIDRGHFPLLHIKTSEWKPSWTEQGGRQIIVFQGHCPHFKGHPLYLLTGGPMEIWSRPLVFSKVSLTIRKSEISPNKTKLKQKYVIWWCIGQGGQGQGSLSNHVRGLLAFTSEKG